MRAVVTAEFTDEGLAALERLGYEVVYGGWAVTHHELTGSELVETLADAEVLVCEVERIDGPILDCAPGLRLVASCRGTPTNIDIAAATERGIAVINTPARNAASVADFTIGLLLSEARSIGRSEAHLRGTGWNVGDELPYFHFRGPELAGRTLGLIGYGAIGRLVAHRAARGFDMRVLAYDPYVTVTDGDAELTRLDDLLTTSDFVSLHCPLTPETVGLIGRRELGLMKSSAYFINTSRAPVVDETALVEWLEAGRLAGAALDVFWDEPLPRDHPLLQLRSVTLTPHVGGASDDVRAHQVAMVLSDIRRWRAGEQPERLTNPSVWRDRVL